MILLTACLILGMREGYALETLDQNRLVEAIKRAENSTAHPYGVMRSYCKPNDPDGQCRRGCAQTVAKWAKMLEYASADEFIDKFGDIYAPTKGATNDPKGLNRNWKNNTKYFYAKLKNKI